MKSNPDVQDLLVRVQKIYYSKNNFSAGILEPVNKKDQIKFKAFAELQEGDSIFVTGSYVQDKKYGRTFTVEQFSYNKELSKNGLIEYLSKCKEIAGVGPAKATKFVESLSCLEDIFRLTPQELSKNSKLNVEICEIIQRELKNKRLHTEILDKVKGFDISFNSVNKLIKTYGNNTLTILTTDPYCIIGNVPGFAFKKVDAIALKMGISPTSDKRISECVKFVVNESINKGNSYIEKEILIKECNKTLHIDDIESKKLITKTLEDLLSQGTLVSEKDMICRPDVHMKEKWLAEWLKTYGHNDYATDVDINELYNIAPYMSLNAGQKAALEKFIKYNKLVITGGAGVGKSYLTNSILNLCDRLNLTTVLCSPTGKAAKRLQHYTGRTAHTIHKLLGYTGNEYTLSNPLISRADVFIVDEVSMCGTELLHVLLSCINQRAVVVLIGDSNQLPPVSYGSLLKDAITYYDIPKAILTQCQRQAGELKENCHLILSGKVAKSSEKFIGDTQKKAWYKITAYKTPEEIQNYLKQAYEKSIPDKFNFDLLHDVQLLTPTHKGSLGTVELNKILQKVIQHKVYGREIDIGNKFYVGDKVVNKENNYNKDIMNGSIGVIKSIQDIDHMVVTFDDRDVELQEDEIDNLKLAYATTVHAYQGDQIKLCLFICHKSHCFQHNRNLLYTAVTRAQQSVAIIGDLWAITECASKTSANDRNSLLYLFKE